MSVNTFDTEESNSNINSPQYYVDFDGSLKFISPILASSNFDGSVPIFEGQLDAEELTAGMSLGIGEDYFPIIGITKDDPELEDSPSTNVTLTYLDGSGDEQNIVYDALDPVDVRYENWSEKYLGTQGWALTYGGNAIFANVGVRGDIEATTLNVGGENGITYDGETVTIGASVVINAAAEFNGGDLSASYATYDFLTASYTTIYDLSSSGRTVINGSNITTGAINASLITTGFLSASRINGGVISGQTISGGTIFGSNIIGGTGNFTGDIQVTSTVSGVSGSVYLTKNSITGSGPNATFPAVDIRYNYLNTFFGRGTLGFGLRDSLPAFRLSSDTSVPMQIFSGSDMYIAANTGIGARTYIYDPYFIGTISGLPIVVSTQAPTAQQPASNYTENTVWYVV